MEPVHYLRAFKRRWPVIVAAVVVAVAAASVTTETVVPPGPAPTTYQATAVIWDSSSTSIGGGEPPIAGLAALASLATLPDTAALAAEKLGYHGDPLKLREHVQAVPDRDAGFLDITGLSEAPREAERIAEAFAAGLVQYLQDLKADRNRRTASAIRHEIAALRLRGAALEQITPLQDDLRQLALNTAAPVGLTVIQHATAEPLPQTGFQPPRSRRSRLLIALAIGVLAGLALALVLERFDTRIRTRQVAEQHFGLPVLSEVPVMSRRERKTVSTAARPTGSPADAFRLLAASVSLAANGQTGDTDGRGATPPDGKAVVAANLASVLGGFGKRTPVQPNGEKKGQPATILVTSPGPSDGKTTVAANLAAAFAELGKRVLVLSCDLRRPLIHRLFGVPVVPGLSDVLANDGAFVGLQPVSTSVRNVTLVPSGGSPWSPGELLGSPRMRRVLEESRRRADVVILDTSPVLVGSDVAALLPQVDAVLLVAKAGRTRVELAERTADVLRQLGAPAVGVALNCAKEITMPTSHRRYYGGIPGEVVGAKEEQRA